jgi:hypothetical protein
MTEAERERILAESRRLLSDDEPTPPRDKPAREVRVEFEDPMDRWRREGNESDAARARAKRELPREEHAMREERAMHTRATEFAATADVRLAALDERVGEIEQRLAAFDVVAKGAVSFSNAATERLHALAALTDRLERTVEQMRETHKRECDALRDRLASSEALHTRETVLLTKQLTDAQRELDVRASLREHAASRIAVAGLDEKVENVVALVREDIAQRRR